MFENFNLNDPQFNLGPSTKRMMTTLFKFSTLQSGELDEVAPLTTTEGIHMRFDLARDLTEGILLLGAIGWLPKEVRHDAATKLVAFVDEARVAGNKLGLEISELPDAAKKLLSELN